MSNDLASYRQLFPVTERYIYMNHAAVGPLPRTAVERIDGVARSISESGDEGWLGRIDEIARVRGLAAQLLGAATPHEVAFVANTSDGLSIVSAGLDWRDGDNIVGAEGEFPSNVYPWMQLARLGVSFRQAPERDGRIDTDELLSLADDRTRVVAISWIEFATGFRFDLERIGRFCRERGILFVVDAIQGLGALPIDVERDHIDVLASSAHKWLLGSEGIGLVYISDRVVERITPARIGWTSVDNWIKWSRYELKLRPGAERHEIGTLNPFGVSALGASLEILLEVGAERIAAHCRELTDHLASGLATLGCRIVSPRTDGEWSPILAVTHPDVAPHVIVDHLASRRISVAHRTGRVRIAPHFYNTHDEVDRLLDAL
ncbi:MAG TPA: aminotransferase class V-fold PLP-dependent enzyme [Blastocatellia bacterium]|nr:aminotransferase class V-fold PLP-dependent enzyme [Blastocatellia bacterium]